MKNRTLTYLKPERSVEILNQLVGMLDCSLARYLSYAQPWARRPYMLLDALARRLSHEHESFAACIAQLIVARRGIISRRQFPMDFTYYNDLSLEYLAPRLLEHQRALIVSAEQCAGELTHDPEAQRLVNQLVTSLRQYSSLLVELLAPHRLAAPLAGEDRGRSLRHNDALSTPSKKLRQNNLEPQSAA